MEIVHTCYRIGNPEKSIAFYEALGLEKRRELPIGDEAVNYFLGVPGADGPELELTYNFGVSEYELGTGYGHVAARVDDLEAVLERLRGEHGERGCRALGSGFRSSIRISSQYPPQGRTSRHPRVGALGPA